MLAPDSLPKNYTDISPAVQFTKGERPFSIRQNSDAHATPSVQGGGLADYERDYLASLLASFPVRSLADLIIVRDGVATIRADIPLHALSLEDACTLQGLAAGGRLPAPPMDDECEHMQAVKTVPPGVLDTLTGRQRDVLALLRQGKPNREIGVTLGLTEGTVKIHVTALLKALGATNRTQVAVMVEAMGGEG